MGAARQVQPRRAGLSGRGAVLTSHAEGSLDDAAAEAARRLETAQATRIPCRPVRDLLARGAVSDGIDAAYQVQSAVIAGRTAAGARVVGRKVGLTNPKVQAQLGVDRPDFGVLLDDMRCQQDKPIDSARLLQPRIEAEIAFILRTDLDHAGGISEADVAAATSHVVAALEIVDSRVAGWDITALDTIADNGSAALFVLGEQHVPPGGLDLAAVVMTMTRDGVVASEGNGADCLGSPLTAVAWLAETARGYGSPLRAGDIILSGALGPMAAVEPGSSFTAEITGVGTVTASFTETTTSPGTRQSTRTTMESS